MHQISLIQKRRIWFAEIAKFTAALSIIVLLAFIWLRDYFPEQDESLINTILIVIFIISALIIRIPLKKHKENGLISFCDNYLLVEIFTKEATYNMCDIKKMEIDIQGYFGQEYLRLNDIMPIEDGTENFITISHKYETKRFELYLKSREDLAILKKYAKFYEPHTIIKLTEKHN